MARNTCFPILSYPELTPEGGIRYGRTPAGEWTGPMSSPLFRALHHVALICSDYERSKHFYSEVLGFRIIHEVYRADRASHKLDLEISPTQHLELFSFPSPPARPTRPEACGLRHLRDLDTDDYHYGMVFEK